MRGRKCIQICQPKSQNRQNTIILMGNNQSYKIVGSWNLGLRRLPPGLFKQFLQISADEIKTLIRSTVRKPPLERIAYIEILKEDSGNVLTCLTPLWAYRMCPRCPGLLSRMPLRSKRTLKESYHGRKTKAIPNSETLYATCGLRYKGRPWVASKSLKGQFSDYFRGLFTSFSIPALRVRWDMQS
jgi:hypothetical protein